MRQLYTMPHALGSWWNALGRVAENGQFQVCTRSHRPAVSVFTSLCQRKMGEFAIHMEWPLFRRILTLPLDHGAFVAKPASERLTAESLGTKVRFRFGLVLSPHWVNQKSLIR